MDVDAARPIVDSGRKRQLIGLAWDLTQLAIGVVLFFTGGVVAALLAVYVFSGHGIGLVVPVGFGLGVTVALVVNHGVPSWLQRLRLRGLRTGGVRVKAEVTDLDRKHTAAGLRPGSTRYTVLVRWTDPSTGRGCQGERRYRFMGKGSSGLESACAQRATVSVLYPPGRPSRFIIDIPFAPTMPDFFL